MTRCRFGLYEFDVRSVELRREGEVVKLSPQPARVLALLLARAGEVILREEFQREIWGNDTFVDFERGLNFCILQVRGALGDSSDNPRFVQTVPRKGYRFIAPVTSVAPASSVAHAATSASPDDVRLSPAPSSALEQNRRLLEGQGARREGRRPRWWLAAAAAAALLASLAWLAWLALANRPGTAPAAAVSTPSRIRIAVLPFVNLTGDRSADYLADGLTDELITQLGTLSRQRVAGSAVDASEHRCGVVVSPLASTSRGRPRLRTHAGD